MHIHVILVIFILDRIIVLNIFKFAIIIYSLQKVLILGFCVRFWPRS